MECQSHCSGCIDIFCKGTAQCPVESCKNGCGFSLHQCKWVEHDQQTCPEALVGCVNACFGCTDIMARKYRGIHLKRCSASTLQCRFAHCRYPAEKGEECALLDNQATLIDEQLLMGDMHLIEESNESGRPPCQLGISIENCSYLASKHNSRPNLSNTYAKGRYLYLLPEDSRQIIYCNEVIRRDEFVAHWQQFHIEVQLSAREVTQRCPLLMYGCTYGRENLTPTPKGTTMNYNQESDALHVLSPSHPSSNMLTRQTSSSYEEQIRKKQELAMYGYGEDEEESYDVLGQLPAEILTNIVQHLDSISLWSLSQTNHYLRKVSFNVIKRKGIVYFKWMKEADGNWTPSPKV